MGHARVLAGLKSGEEQKTLRDLIIKRALSVRQTEALVKKTQEKGPVGKKQEAPDHYMKSLEDGLKRTLGTKVDIRRRGKQGSIVIHFYSDEELDRLLEVLA